MGLEHQLSRQPEQTEKAQPIPPGLDEWAKSLLNQGIIGRELFDDFIAQNNSKEQNLREWKLPQLKHYGFYSSVDEIREKLSPLKDELFIIRCKSKKDGAIAREPNYSLDQACAFAEKLPGGIAEWEVEMKEFVPTKASGTIIIQASGETFIEEWRGPHYENNKNAEKLPRYYGELKPDDFQHGFQWQGPQNSNDLPEMREYAIRALRYLFPHLKPHENDPVYVEYGVDFNDNIFFIEANNSPLLTGEFWKKYSPRRQNSTNPAQEQ